MDIIAIIKDVMGIVGPIVVAYISYRSNKKSNYKTYKVTFMDRNIYHLS